MPNVDNALTRPERSIVNKATYAVVHSPTSFKHALLDRTGELTINAIETALTPSPPCEACGRSEREAAPWAARIVAEAFGAVGSMSTVVIQIAQRFGARDEQELSNLIESGRKLEGLGDMSVLAQLEAALEVVKMCLGREPEHARMVRKALESYAEVEE